MCEIRRWIFCLHVVVLRVRMSRTCYCLLFLLAMAFNLIAMAFNVQALQAMASNLEAMASNLGVTSSHRWFQIFRSFGHSSHPRTIRVFRSPCGCKFGHSSNHPGQRCGAGSVFSSLRSRSVPSKTCPVRRTESTVLNTWSESVFGPSEKHAVLDHIQAAVM